MNESLIISGLFHLFFFDKTVWLSTTRISWDKSGTWNLALLSLLLVYSFGEEVRILRFSMEFSCYSLSLVSAKAKLSYRIIRVYPQYQTMLHKNLNNTDFICAETKENFWWRSRRTQSIFEFRKRPVFLTKPLATLQFWLYHTFW